MVDFWKIQNHLKLKFKEVSFICLQSTYLGEVLHSVILLAT